MESCCNDLVLVVLTQRIRSRKVSSLNLITALVVWELRGEARTRSRASAPTPGRGFTGAIRSKFPFHRRPVSQRLARPAGADSRLCALKKDDKKSGNTVSTESSGQQNPERLAVVPTNPAHKIKNKSPAPGNRSRENCSWNCACI